MELNSYAFSSDDERRQPFLSKSLYPFVYAVTHAIHTQKPTNGNPKNPCLLLSINHLTSFTYKVQEQALMTYITFMRYFRLSVRLHFHHPPILARSK